MVAAVWKHLTGKEVKEVKKEKEDKKGKEEKEVKKDSLLYPGRAPWEVHNSYLYLFNIFLFVI